MSERFVLVDRDTPFLLEPSVQEWLPENHLARFIVDIVDRLDLSRLQASYAGRGSAAYHPAMLTALLFFGYATGVFSSRKLEAATYDSLAMRFICANTHPDHDTIASFRKRFFAEIAALFVQVLEIAHDLGVLKLGTVSLDGSKVKAYASKHKALSYGHAQKLEAQLRQEVEQLMAMAEAADTADDAAGLDIPAEIERRTARLEAIEQAKKRIEQRAAERAAEEAERHQRKRVNKENGSTPPGSSSGVDVRSAAEVDAAADDAAADDAPAVVPKAKEQVNLTDEQSRIMPTSGGGFEQAYNAQAIVDVDSMLVLGALMTQKANDAHQVEPAVAHLGQLPDKLGKVHTALADNGFCSEENVERFVAAGITPMLALGREAHNIPLSDRLSDPPPLPDDASSIEKMKHRMRSREGRALYGKRKSTVEPVFGIIKHVMGFRQFSVRGVELVAAEWQLVAAAFNLRRLFKLAGG